MGISLTTVDEHDAKCMDSTRGLSAGACRGLALHFGLTEAFR